MDNLTPSFDIDFVLFILGIALGAVQGFVVANGPTWLFLRNFERLWGDEFAYAHPDKKWVVVTYPLFAIPIVLGAFYITIKATAWPPLSLSPIFFYQAICLMAAGRAILSGLLEIFVGVSPVPRGRRGWWRAPWLNQYIYSEGATREIRRVGLLRIWWGVLFIPLSLSISWLLYHSIPSPK